MSIAYRIEFNSAYARQMIKRYYEQRPFLFKPVVQFSLLLIAGIAMVLFESNDAATWTTAAATAIVGPLFVFVAVQATIWGIIEFRFKGRPDFGKETTVTLSDDGVAATGEHVETNWDWRAYPSSVRFRDGILLMRPGVIRWLPDSAIQDGTPDQATRLVSAKTSIRSVDRGSVD